MHATAKRRCCLLIITIVALQKRGWNARWVTLSQRGTGSMLAAFRAGTNSQRAPSAQQCGSRAKIRGSVPLTHTTGWSSDRLTGTMPQPDDDPASPSVMPSGPPFRSLHCVALPAPSARQSPSACRDRVGHDAVDATSASTSGEANDPSRNRWNRGRDGIGSASRSVFTS